MATFTEIWNQIRGNAAFMDKINVAINGAAQAVVDETRTDPITAKEQARLDWALLALGNSGQFEQSAFWYMVMLNSGESVAAILGADDTGSPSIQEAVDAWRDAVYPAT